MTRKKLVRKKLVRKRPIGVLTSPTKTFSAEVFVTDKTVKEQDFVYMFDENRKRIIGRIEELQSEWNKAEDGVDTYADIAIYGMLNERGKITLKRKPLKPDTKVYKMTPKRVAKLLGLEDGIYIGKMIDTETKVHIDFDKFLRGHTIDVGKTGSGKSWGVGVILEEVSKRDLPVIVIDPHGEYLSLAQPYAGDEALKALEKWGLEPQGFKVKIITANPETKTLGQEYITVYWPESQRAHQDPNVRYQRYGILSMSRGHARDSEEESVTADELPKFVTLFKELHGEEPSIGTGQDDIRESEKHFYDESPNLLDPNISQREETTEKTFTIRKGVIDMKLEEIMEPGFITVIDLHNLDPEESRAAVDWLEFRLFLLRKQKKISPFVNVIEEAHIFCPSQGKEWSSDTMLMLAKEARKFGMPTVFVTQRPVLLNTTIRANCENWIVLKITHPGDKSSIIDACEGLDSNSSKTIKNLPVGCAFLTGTIVEFPLVVEIRHRQSQHHYESGFREQLEKYEETHAPRKGDDNR